MDDIEHIAFMRNMRQPPRWFLKKMLYLQLPTLMWGQRKAMKLARRVYVCSDHDKQYLEHNWGLTNISCIPNSVDIPEEQPITPQQTLLFLGSYNYEPNKNAAEYLIDKIWPLIHEKVPGAQLIIAGSDCENLAQFSKKNDAVEFTGFVDDIEQLYRISGCLLSNFVRRGNPD
jgi:glycosyltransferase involved in cell wall biosynthesis